MAKKRPRAQPARSGFVLHRFNGDEIYSIESAEMFAIARPTGATLWFEVAANRNATRRCEDTADMGMAPKAEVAVDLAELDAEDLVGRTFSIPGAKTDDEDSCKALFYYFEHEPLRKNKITVVSQKGDRFWLRWTAVTKDVNYYDGSKPATKIEIEGEFRFKDIGKWRRRRTSR